MIQRCRNTASARSSSTPAEARRFLDALMTFAPDVTIASIRAGQAAKDPGRIEPILEGLRLAGLEEG